MATPSATARAADPLVDVSASPAASATPSPATTTTALAVSPARGPVGTTFTLAVAVLPNPGAGDVAWLEDGTQVGTTPLLPDGTASMPWTPNSAGTHAWSAQFVGTDGFAGSASPEVDVVVDAPVTTSIGLRATVTRALAGTLVTVSAAVEPNPGGGTIVWRQDGAPIGSSPLGPGGAASVDLTLPAGTTVVEAVFSGSIGFEPSTASVSLVGVPPPDPVCTQPLVWAKDNGVTADDVRSGRLAMLGSDVTVSPASFDPRVSPVATAAWAMWYRSLYWLVPVAEHAYLHGDAADEGLVAAYVAGYASDPDPGSATDALRAQAAAAGWDEGTNLRREEALNCLMRLTPSTAVEALLRASVTANLDTARYYGRPLRRPHNHGLMANLALIASSDVLADPSLLDAAQGRLLTDLAGVADACGMVFEQSARYQTVNADLWAMARDALAAHGRLQAAASIAGATARMSGAYDELVRPDGQLEVIGDGAPHAGYRLASHAGTPLRMLCRSAGWAAARTSWTTTASSYVFRFGPSRWAHGHADHGSVTWTQAGRPVLVDGGGTIGYTTAAATAAISNAAHNVLSVTGATLASTSSLLRVSTGSGRDLYVIRDAGSGVTRTRSLRVEPAFPFIVTLDRAHATSTRTYVGRWHFDPRWRWDAARGQLTDGTVWAGVVVLDLRSGRMVPVAAGRSAILAASGSAGSAPVLSVTRRSADAALFSVAYVSTTGVRPVLRWRPGPTRGTGVVRIWWGRRYRDVAIDATGIR